MKRRCDDSACLEQLNGQIPQLSALDSLADFNSALFSFVNQKTSDQVVSLSCLQLLLTTCMDRKAFDAIEIIISKASLSEKFVELDVVVNQDYLKCPQFASILLSLRKLNNSIKEAFELIVSNHDTSMLVIIGSHFNHFQYKVSHDTEVILSLIAVKLCKHCLMEAKAVGCNLLRNIGSISGLDYCCMLEKEDFKSMNTITLYKQGALYNLIEDESKIVKIEAVRTIKEIAIKHSTLIEKCQSMILDMMNDEYDDVRLEAINNLIALCNYMKISDLEVGVVIFNLREQNPLIRDAIYKLISHMKISNERDFLILFESLKSNASIPEDRMKIFECIVGVGKVNSEIVIRLIREILHINDEFTPKEPYFVEDISYQCSFILIVNAIGSIERCGVYGVPGYFSIHYKYLRDEFPNMIPHGLKGSELSGMYEGFILGNAK